MLNKRLASILALLLTFWVPMSLVTHPSMLTILMLILLPIFLAPLVILWVNSYYQKAVLPTSTSWMEIIFFVCWLLLGVCTFATSTEHETPNYLPASIFQHWGMTYDQAYQWGGVVFYGSLLISYCLIILLSLEVYDHKQHEPKPTKAQIKRALDRKKNFL